MEIGYYGPEMAAEAAYLTREYRRMTDEITMKKITELGLKACENGYLDLAAILIKMNLTNLVETKSRLEKLGYTLEVSIPQIKTEFRQSFDRYEAVETIDPDEIKVKIRKTILES